MSYKKQELLKHLNSPGVLVVHCFEFTSTWIHLGLLLFIVLSFQAPEFTWVSCCSLFWVHKHLNSPGVIVVHCFELFVLSYYASLCSDFRIKRCSVQLSVQLFAGGLIYYWRYLCLFAYSGVQLIVCCVLFCFLHFVYPMLPLSLDCRFLVAPLVFSNVYC
jgi:hypothetical protein